LTQVVELAHAHGLPVLVDAAGEVPPRANLRDIVATGADLVAFSGGKAIRGPQATGILCGRRHLIGSAALQMLDMDDHWDLWEPPPDLIDKKRLRGMPRHGIGRALKVSKEQIAALLTALKQFTSGAYDRDLPVMRGHLERIASSLAGLPVACRIITPSDGESVPLLEIGLADAARAWAVCRGLRRGRPSVQVGHGRLHEGVLVIHPLHLNEDRTAVLAQRLREELTPCSPS
jgi:L-seryl-tRNA(Ser) seleniumtransferase